MFLISEVPLYRSDWVEAPESLGVAHPGQGSKLGTTTLHNVNLALWEATKRIATAAPSDAEAWQVYLAFVFRKSTPPQNRQLIVDCY